MWIVAGTVDADEFSFRCTKLFQGNKYLFRVTAENRVGSGDAAELSEPVIAKLPYGRMCSCCFCVLCFTHADTCTYTLIVR